MSLTAARQRRIADLVQHDREVEVAGLARLLGVSEMTIRRDLKQLERAGRLTRVHGGAVLRPVPSNPPLRERMVREAGAKELIAKQAAMLVEEGHRLYLGSGSTTLALGRRLAAGPACRVVTNVPDLVDAMSGDGRHELNLTGGRYEPAHRGLYGSLALAAIEDRIFDIAFIGAYALDAELGVLDRDEFQFRVQRILARQARLHVVLADHTKFGRPANFRALAWSAVDALVTDRRPPVAYVEALQRAGTRILVPGELRSAAGSA